MTQDTLLQFMAIARNEKGYVRLSLQGADISGLTFAGLVLEGSCFRDCKAIGTDFRSCSLHYCDFSGARLDETMFEHATLPLHVGDALVHGANFGRGMRVQCSCPSGTVHEVYVSSPQKVLTCICLFNFSSLARAPDRQKREEEEAKKVEWESEYGKLQVVKL